MTSLVNIHDGRQNTKIYKPQSSPFYGSIKTNLTYTLLTSSPSGYHFLPSRVLTSIFQYFDEKELRKNISPVCKHWRYVAQQPQLWKTLHFNETNVPTLFICQKIRDLPNIQFLYLKDIAEPIIVIRQICRWLPNIKYLQLKNCPAVPENSLRNLIQCCKSLEGLDLNGTEFKSKRFFEEIAGLTSLKSINLSQNSKLNVCNILSTALNCRQLVELKLSSFCPSDLEQLQDQDASLIIQNLANTLKSLTLDTGNLSECSFKTIMNCNKLEKLGLYRAINLSPDLFVNLWKSLPNLKMLKIRQALHITGLHVAELFQSGRHAMKYLIAIDFTDCWKVNDIGIEAIANCCKNLKALTVRGCKSITSLQEINQKCKKLEKLNIAFCLNLDLSTITPLPKHLNTIILDTSKKFSNLIETTLREKKIAHIKVCLSQFNKEIQKITNDSF